jgi:integrase
MKLTDKECKSAKPKAKAYRLFDRTRRAIWLSLYTFCRPKEIRMARWQDINLDEKLWMVPAEIMKMKHDHMVPLSTRAIKTLQAQRLETDILNSEWVWRYG